MVVGDRASRARYSWVLMYEDTGDAGLTCRRCGISRPTLRHWWRRYVQFGKDGLASESRARTNPPQLKLTSEGVELILQLRRSRKVGPKSLQSILEREHSLRLSTATIWKVLRSANVSLLRHPKIPDQPVRYSRPFPGERVQLDSMKVAAKLYQFTAIDDCTRMRILGLYPARTAANSVDFLLERVLEEFPFSIEHIQTDRGGEFFGHDFQQAMKDCCIKFRPVPPGSPHLNGKVERSHQTDRIEFWATADLKDPDLEARLGEWQHYYNWQRPHTSLNGRIPIDVCCELLEKTPLAEERAQLYDPAKEPIRVRNYWFDMRALALSERATIESM